jgi:hypothetical protein
MFDLLILIGLDELLFVLKIVYSFFTKQALKRRSIVLSLSLQLVFPALYVRNWGIDDLKVLDELQADGLYSQNLFFFVT